MAADCGLAQLAVDGKSWKLRVWCQEEAFVHTAACVARGYDDSAGLSLVCAVTPSCAKAHKGIKH